MLHHLIRRVHDLQRMTGMPRSITRRGLAAIVAILRQLPFDLAQSSQHLLQHLSQGGIFRSFPRQFSLESGALRSFCGQFPLQLSLFFFCRHALSLAALSTLPV